MQCRLQLVADNREHLFILFITWIPGKLRYHYFDNHKPIKNPLLKIQATVGQSEWGNDAFLGRLEQSLAI